MLDIALNAFESESETNNIRERIKKMDIKKINRRHKEIRKMIIEHLVISKGEDLLQGLQLSVVIDKLAASIASRIICLTLLFIFFT